MKVRIAATETVTTYYVVEVKSLAEAKELCRKINKGDAENPGEFDGHNDDSRTTLDDFRVTEQLPDSYEPGTFES